MKNIFVGNLDFNTSEEDVRQLFAAYGWVDRVTIVRDRDTDQPRGFGFVEMASAEDGKRAIAALNGTLLGDRALNVNEARPRPERAGGAGRAENAAEAANVGNYEATLSSEHLMSGFPKGRGCDVEMDSRR